MKGIITFPTDKDVEGLPDDCSVVIMEGALAGMPISVRSIRGLNKACKEYMESQTEFTVGKKGRIKNKRIVNEKKKNC